MSLAAFSLTISTKLGAGERWKDYISSVTFDSNTMYNKVILQLMGLSSPVCLVRVTSLRSSYFHHFITGGSGQELDCHVKKSICWLSCMYIHVRNCKTDRYTYCGLELTYVGRTSILSFDWFFFSFISKNKQSRAAADGGWNDFFEIITFFSTVLLVF